jgi:hypothetical protein
MLAEWRADAAEVRKDLKRIAEMMSGLKLCPAPGDCLHIRQDLLKLDAQCTRLMDDIEARLEHIENVRLRAVEDKMNFFKGSVILVGSLASILVGALTHWLFSLIRR